MSITPSGLVNPRAKLRRADEHLEQLIDEAKEFAATDPYSVFNEERAPDLDVALIRMRETPPLRLGVILGDVLFNWRSALDNLAHELVLLGGGEPSGATAFPIFRDEADFVGRGRRKLDGMAADHAETIEGLQPFRSPEDQTVKALATVDKLSNFDKHRMVHPALTAIVDPDAYAHSFKRETTDGEAFFEIETVGFGKPLRDGSELARIRWQRPIPDPKPRVSSEFNVQLGFGDKGLRIGALPIVRWHVNAVVECFAPAFGESTQLDPEYWDDRPSRRRSGRGPGRGSG